MRLLKIGIMPIQITMDNGNYYIIGWQGEKYVAINGKIDKLSKLIIEHGTSQGHEINLVVGESWDIGDGWIITANAIDAYDNWRIFS